jgi:hypothetical protein
VEQERNLLPGNHCTYDVQKTHCRLLEGAMRQEHPSYTDSEQGRRVPAGDKGRHEANAAQYEPATWDKGQQQHCTLIHCP